MPVEVIGKIKPKNNGNFSVVDAQDVEIDAQTRLPAKLTDIGAQITALMGGREGRPMIYCWGDSLTEGVGGGVLQRDEANDYMLYSYPMWVGQTYDTVNLGARSEDVTSIMARQGTDPIVIETGFTIPAACTPVKVLTATHIYDPTEGTGFKNRSGKKVNIHKEVESPGFNPCTIAGVEGILYREIGNSAVSDEAEYDYYFLRLKAGTESKTVTSGTTVNTFAMNNYRNGIAIIWMGANGGYSSKEDFVYKVNDMVQYGQYINYLVILGREMGSAESRAYIKQELTDQDGFCHVIDLLEQLPYRGYAMAGIPYESVDKTGWPSSENWPASGTIDPIKEAAPLLCEYLSSQSGHEKYGGLHYSAWGYKAIGKLVVEKLGEMGLVSGGSNGNNGPSTAGVDEFGEYLYKLPEAKNLTGYNYINTKVKLYDDVEKDWTFAIRWSGTPYSPYESHWPCNIFCCARDTVMKGILYRYHASGEGTLFIGTGAYTLNGDDTVVDNWGETNVCVIAKRGDDYTVFLNGHLVSGTEIHSAMQEEDGFRLPLIIGARHNLEGTEVQYKTAITVEDCRVYKAGMETDEAWELYSALAAEDE